MTRTNIIRLAVTSLVASLAVMAGVGLGAAAADGPTFIATATTGPGGLTVGTGCAASCITKAAVTTTTTTATVELATSVLAHLTVSVVKDGIPSGSSGGLTANPTKTVSISAFVQNRTASFTGLEPDTVYAISVKATDLKGQINVRHGTFKTNAIQTAGLGGPDSLDTGVGCSTQCITQAAFVQQKPSWSTAKVDIKTNADARISVVVSTDKPTPTAAGLVQHQVVYGKGTTAFGRSLVGEIAKLRPASTYYAVVRAIDAQGRTSTRQGSFRTVDATALVTIHKIKVVEDGDWGPNRGELMFRFYENEVERSGGTGWRKLSSGSVIDAGVHFAFDLRTAPTARISVTADECDAVRLKNCPIEAGLGDYDAIAGGSFNFVNLLLGGNALPAWYGTGVSAPAGHDAYLVVGSGNGGEVEFLALATLDLHVKWPS
jgi:hypothetical protein